MNESTHPAAAGSTDAPGAEAATGSGVDSIRVIDTDVHHSVRDKTDLYPYLARADRERLDEYDLPRNNSIYQSNGGYRGKLAEGVDRGKQGNIEADFVRFQSGLLNDCGIDRAILVGGSVAPYSALTDIDYSAALCRAFNDWTLEHWLGREPRFRFAMAVPTQSPSHAVEEIRRIGSHPGVVAVHFSCGSTRLYGQRFFDPIYAACVERDLVLALHFSNEGFGVNPPPTAAGFPSYYAETYLIRPQFYQSHLSSFLFEGTFEKFPGLKVAFLESGFGWVPSFRWRADVSWKALRSQTPWVKRPPSETIDSHIRFSTQPFEECSPPAALDATIAWMNGAESLMFSSDFPHWDFDHPRMLAGRFEVGVRRRILCENALATFPKLK